MLLHIPMVFSAPQAQALRTRLLAPDAPWVDGRATAGHQGAPVKHNRQIAEHSPLARELGDTVLAALERNPLFISAALPNHVYPPMFNRYAPGMDFGDHVDGAVRMVPGTTAKLRTDLSATLFLTPPEDYEGGELQILDSSQLRSIKLAAGDLILYPSTYVHRVEAVTRGERVSCFFWVQSLVRDAACRSLLFDMDRAIQRLGATNADAAARVQLTGCYHNLLRRWSET
ncbi:MAG: Fe2+-dependent dioxygenase [Nevskiaceae bacterium]|nr:MAG: Fe2+-dependent dioxygenase [Nevskiaceae bacterium]TBR73063.1 MAG: Fe2+-dependent dioxygenase [Nevskiaceae bacterium]